MRAQVLAVLLLLPSAVSAQDVDSALAAVVRISGRHNEIPARGSGFVVARTGSAVTVVTASHVVQRAHFEVVFSGSTERFADVEVLHMEADGLAVLEVRGTIPRGVTVLEVDKESRPGPGTSLFVLGFPQISPVPQAKQRIVSARIGTRLVIDQPIGEGFSGGAVIRGGKAVGIVTKEDDQSTYAIKGVVIGAFLEDLPVTLGASGEVVAEAVPSKPPCVSGSDVRTFEGIEFVRICVGSFMMGSADGDWDERRVHQVTLSEYWIGKYEVTNKQYRRFRPDHEGADNLPAVDVNWTEARDFCASFGFQLPTEAQWENAARAGSTARWSFGNNEGALARYAWYGEDFADKGTAHPVGTKEPNKWGIHDMYGNVQEWVADWIRSYSDEPRTDPPGPSSGPGRGVRGGSFISSPASTRSASRFYNTPKAAVWFAGFRCARVGPASLDP